MKVKALVRPKFSLFLLLGLLLALMLAPAANAAVSTDAYYYGFGDTVQITGDGMASGENVTIYVYAPPGSDTILAAEPWQSQADDNGSFATSLLLSADMPVGEYSLTAVGETSGATFYCVFDPLTLKVGDLSGGSGPYAAGGTKFTDTVDYTDATKGGIVYYKVEATPSGGSASVVQQGSFTQSLSL